MEIHRQIENGMQYLAAQLQRGRYTCEIGKTRDLKDSYKSPEEVGSSLLVLGTVGERLTTPLEEELTTYVKGYISGGRFHFFADPSLLPADSETTSYGLSVLLNMDEVDLSLATEVAQQIISNTNEPGIVQIYFEKSPNENRTDHVASSNMMYFINQVGLGMSYAPTQMWLEEILKSGQYLDGSRYYHSPDAFIYFLSRAILRFPLLGDRLGNATIDALHTREGSTTYPLDLAMRVCSAKRLGLNTTEEGLLMSLQLPDGSWPKDAIYHYGGRLGYFGSSVISTAFALEAIVK